MVLPVLNRLRGVLLLFGVFALIIAGQIVRFQFIPDRSAWIDRVNQGNQEQYNFAPPRGRIYDRNGELLATNEIGYQIGASTFYVDDPGGSAEALAGVFPDLSKTELEQLIAYKPRGQHDDFVFIRRFATRQQGEALLAIREDDNGVDLRGITIDILPHRVYANGTLAAHTIGFVPLAGEGIAGLEGAYNDILTGTDAGNRRPVVPFDAEDAPNPTAGADVHITIDRDIQFLTEQVLAEALRTHGAESGTIIVMDPRNGEILAMASLPSYDPNDWTLPGGGSELFNPAVSHHFEPGSTFKVLTMAAALDSGTVTPETTYFDTGSVEVGGITIRNWDGGAWGQQDMNGLMQHSLNVGMATVAVNMGPTLFYNYLDSFGIGEQTRIDLTDELPGWLRTPENSALQPGAEWTDSDLATNSFGQGLTVTPIQLITAVSAIANDGVMMQPHLLRHYVTNDGVYAPPQQIISRPISAQTAQTLTEMLATSLEREASVALVPGYRLAGKTGTAEISAAWGYTDETIGSFIGWGPVDDPRFIVLVKLDKPTSSIWGSQTAAPVFSQLVERLVVLLGLPPDQIRQSIYASAGN